MGEEREVQGRHGREREGEGGRDTEGKDRDGREGDAKKKGSASIIFARARNHGFYVTTWSDRQQTQISCMSLSASKESDRSTQPDGNFSH